MTLIKYMSILTTFSVLFAILSVIYQAFLSLKQLNKLATILTGLLTIETIGQNDYKNLIVKPKVAVGYGACTDLIIGATNFLNFSKLALNIDDDFTIDDVTNYDEFIQSFAYYFRSGAAAERFTSDNNLFKKLIEIAKVQHKNEIRWELGGNAPVMGSRFYTEGADVLLGSQMTEKLRTNLPSAIKFAGKSETDDDIHLILEYKTGDTWGPYIAPRANRYILHNDQNNPKLSSLEDFDRALKDFKPRLLVVSGLQMMDSYKFSAGVRENRLKKLEKQISSQSPETLIHFEMASYVEIGLLKLLLKHVLPFSDSIGMNEQELDNLHKVLSTGQITFASDSNPRVATALDQMRKVFKIINKDYFANNHNKYKKNQRMLSRIHVHTLAYQAILTVKNSKWTKTKTATAKAALTAHRYVCQKNTISPEASTLILDDSFSTSADGINSNSTAPKRIELDPKSPVSCWNELMYKNNNDIIELEICVAPVLVCRIAKKTAGAGDNISAAGLSQQII